MAEISEIPLRADWETLKKAGDKTTSQLEELLAKCVLAGVEIIDPVRREKLQGIAREIADELFLKTEIFPESVIQPPRQSLVDSKAIAGKQSASGRSRQGIFGVAKALLTLRMVAGMVVAAMIVYWVWHYREQVDSLETKLKASADQLEDSRIEIMRLTDAGKPERIDKSLGDVIAERNRARFENDRLKKAIEQSMSALPPVVQEALARDNCLKLIRGCYVNRDSIFNNAFEGAFGVTANPTEIWVVPSQANLAALALIAVAKDKVDSDSTEDKQRVLKWLNWYAIWQEKSGNDDIPTFSGTSLKKEQPIPSKDIDRDAAGTFLMAAQKYYEHCDKPPADEHERIQKAISRSVNCIMTHTRPKLHSPDSPPIVTHLLTGVIDFGGLIAASKYYDRLGDAKASADALLRAKGIALELKAFWQTQKNAELFAKTVSGGRYDVTLKSQEDLQANLVGIAFIKWDNAKLWAVLSSNFIPGNQSWLKNEFARGSAEDWLTASIRLGEHHKAEFDQALWRRRVFITATSYDVNTTYLGRIARTLLVIHDGCKWWPDVREVADKPKIQ